MGQHDSTTPKNIRDSWSTPDWLFRWLDSLYDFDIDLAASSDNAKCHFFFQEEQDALSRNWRVGEIKTGFLNPPYSSIKPWILKSVQELDVGFVTVMVIPTPNGESYYKNVFKHASELIFIHGRVPFVNAETGEPQTGNTRGTCVVVFSERFGSLRVSSFDRNELIKTWGNNCGVSGNEASVREV